MKGQAPALGGIVALQRSSPVASVWDRSGRALSGSNINRRLTHNGLVAYTPPEWVRGKLTGVPTHYVKLAHTPTPIHFWSLPGVPEGFKVSVKRDDMTGSMLGGNKDLNEVSCQGNALLSRAMGSTIVLMPPPSEGEEGLMGLGKKMEDYKKYLEKSGATPYIIPAGAANAVGAWGYIEAFKELMSQEVHRDYDDIVMATGSGGTLCDLAIANYLTGSKLRVHGVCACYSAAYIIDHIDDQLKYFGLDVRASEIASVIEGYKGRGYDLTTDEELAELSVIMRSTGLFLDPCYTLKGVRGMLGEMRNNPARFKGTRILYIHTGGIFDLFAGKINDTLCGPSATGQVLDYREVIPD